MLKRKIYTEIENFYKDNPQKALMITGARQVGKSYIIEQFGKAHYESLIVIDFINNPEYVEIFSGCNSSDEIMLRISSLFGDRLIEGRTLIFFDEVQRCREIITQIKYLVSETAYSYILSGSLLGTVLRNISSVPVGYMSIIRMYPLDFEEFAMANGVGSAVFSKLRSCFESKEPVDAFLHKRLISLYELYLIVGGMPAAVSTYLESNNLRAVADEQLSIISLYKEDISQYDEDEKLYLNDIFELIPSELNAKNKRFILKDLHGYTKFEKYHNSFLWLQNAGVALPVYCADEPKIPLKLSKSTTLFKLFMNDIGLLAAMYGNGIQLHILNHETNINFGSIYENVAAQELAAHGYDLYYYNSKKMGELDFLIENGNEIIPIEIKSGKDYYRHAALENILSCSEYDIREGMVFCNGNIETVDRITYYPIYMLMFLEKKSLPDKLVFKSDFSDINMLV